MSFIFVFILFWRFVFCCGFFFFQLKLSWVPGIALAPLRFVEWKEIHGEMQALSGFIEVGFKKRASDDFFPFSQISKAPRSAAA